MILNRKWRKPNAISYYYQNGFHLEGLTKRADTARNPAISRSTIPCLLTTSNRRRDIVEVATEDNQVESMINQKVSSKVKNIFVPKNCASKENILLNTMCKIFRTMSWMRKDRFFFSTIGSREKNKSKRSNLHDHKTCKSRFNYTFCCLDRNTLVSEEPFQEYIKILLTVQNY